MVFLCLFICLVIKMIVWKLFNLENALIENLQIASNGNLAVVVSCYLFNWPFPTHSQMASLNTGKERERKERQEKGRMNEEKDLLSEWVSETVLDSIQKTSQWSVATVGLYLPYSCVYVCVCCIVPRQTSWHRMANNGLT